MSLSELYQEIILDHGKNPRAFGKLPHANYKQMGHNPLCGDKLTVYLVVDVGIVQNILFEGTGCAISMASASLMIEAVKGKTLDEIDALFADFHELVTTGNEETRLGKLIVFAGVAKYPIRVKCATLAWHTLRAALRGDQQLVTTES